MSLFKSLFGKNKEEEQRKLEKERLEKEQREKELSAIAEERLAKEQKKREELEKEIKKAEKEQREKELIEKEKIERAKKDKYLSFVRELDKNDDGTLDVVEGNDFSNLLKKNQEKIIEINRDYIKQFVQVSMYLKVKRQSLQNVFSSLVDTINSGGVYTSLNSEVDNIDSWAGAKLALVKIVMNSTGLGLQECKDLVNAYFSGDTKIFRDGKIFKPLNDELIISQFEILKDDIHIYNLLLLRSLNMIGALVNNDMITFYETYEVFDNLNMFDSKHERDLRAQLQNVNDNLLDVMNQIQTMGNDIISSINDLSFITEESSQMIADGLQSVNSSIQTSNLISSIQTYQLYRIGKNTNALR